MSNHKSENPRTSGRGVGQKTVLYVGEEGDDTRKITIGDTDRY